MGLKKNSHEQWLLLFNCQAAGLANCMNLLCPEVNVVPQVVSNDDKKNNEISTQLDNYDRIIVAPRVEVFFTEDLKCRKNVWRIPHVFFHGYHPDHCYLISSGREIKGAAGPYHSLIVFAAYCLGFNEAETQQLFSKPIYEMLGYFSRWHSARESFLSAFKDYGIELDKYFINWTRHGSFMHTVNHPKIFVLRDLAKAIVSKAGYVATDTDFLPHDNLANGQYFPVYPEIASSLGFKGGFDFKRGGQYQLCTLDEFIKENFAVYRENENIEIINDSQNKLEFTMSVLKELK